MQFKTYINGREVTLDCDAGEQLSTVLRRHGYLGLKEGCDTGSCGLCTIWMNERPVLSCCVPAPRAEGSELTTIEGVQKEAEEFAKYMVAEGAEQCGFCSPGFTMTVLAMKRELADPTEEDVKHYLSGNLCRCTGYMGQTRAVMKYLEACKCDI
ncbi:(2Fe-2S)-binding domain protein [Denitrovibrio acetiphilus DSM 12809]|jgi:carbon-monoxide dehydrogenase small subunit|uniref:(2Fe-2S)-binding domain protein n=1 Tax=Denitrovibrio acetiphilus (strain DSM 12809 / NBRC 114555 / N2460) TaxID=522772 RepID=D4H1W3_DENA2|nr:2Fe-2S iron-sulfur cluster-binding protein [Denitrovibrio acetiphilus]ADD66940.1 (2Fe-2S)-binding domain protein [Denitrovibrio acetiphilus DSM 12809]